MNARIYNSQVITKFDYKSDDSEHKVVENNQI